MSAYMATNLKPKIVATYLADAPISEGKPAEKPWEVRMGIGQVVAMWVVTGLLMVAVFFFGLFAGREQGLRLALEERDVPTVRLPIGNGLNPEKQAVSTSVLSPLVHNSAANVEPSRSASGSKASGGSASSAVAFDFSAAQVESVNVSSVPAKAEASHDSAGFSAQSANEVLKKNDTTAVHAPAASRPAESQKLADIDTKTKASAVEGNKPAAAPVAASSAVTASGLPAAAKPAAAQAKTSPAHPAAEAAKPATPAKGWFVQVAATDTRSEATALLTKLKAHGQKAVIRDAQVNDVVYYRVLIGPFDSRAEADNSNARVGKMQLGNGRPFVKNF